MSLMFNWKSIPERNRGLTFDDVLVIPQKSEVRSRRDPDLGSRLTKKIKIATPMVSANMDTITESDMMIAMHEVGAAGILHRFMSIPDQVSELKKARAKGVILAASIGVNREDRDRADALVREGAQVLTVDIAHGHSVQMIETIQYLKGQFPGVEVIAGNVATPQGVRELALAGADAIKVGIGPGSMCTTRIITGCGMPQLTAIALCAMAAQEFDIPVIADGGLRTSGDVFKAYAAGAESVMMGSMLAGTLETPGEVHNGMKQYRGMASRKAQESWRGQLPEGMAPEGESTHVTVKGRVRDVILELCGGVRSGMSYVNAISLAEIRERALFMEMSHAGIGESHAHGVRSYSR